MSSYGTCSYEYTRNGELTRRVDSASNSTTEYEYDEFGNLRRVVLPDTRVITYHIDGLNRRVGKSINGVRQWGLLYANQLEPVAELDAAGNVVASFIYADRPHVPSLMLKGGQTYRIVADQLGSVRLVVNIATGAIAQRMTYDEYGNVVEDTNPGFQPFGYAGGVYDRDTGLVRFGARDYDAVVGRWTAKDPIGFGGGDANLYIYVGADPIAKIDITGLQVHLDYNSPGTNEAFVSRSYKRVPGEISLSGHLQPGANYPFDRRSGGYYRDWLTPETAARDIRRLRDYEKGATIRVFICTAGAGENSWAERLHRALGGDNPVEATPGLARLSSDGVGDAFNDINGNLKVDLGEPGDYWIRFE